MENILNNENHEACAACGGKCCKSMGCVASPQDIEKRFGPLTRDTIIAALTCGDFSADCWDGDVRKAAHIKFDETDWKDRCWFLRARHIEAKAVDMSYGGICANLTKHGCKFSWEDRPYGGKALVPNPGGKCHGFYNKLEAAVDWLPYCDLIDDIVNSDEFDDEWTDGLAIAWKSLELKEQGKTIMDLIPD